MLDEASLSDVPDVNNTLNCLNRHVQDSSRKLNSAVKEASRLREENMVLADHVERRDEKIDRLENKCNELEEEIEHQHLDARRRNSATMSECTLLKDVLNQVSPTSIQGLYPI